MATAKPAKTGDTSIYLIEEKKKQNDQKKCVNETIKKIQEKRNNRKSTTTKKIRVIRNILSRQHYETSIVKVT